MVKTSLPPGFRFHPTDVELVWYYLKCKITGKPSRFEAISEIQLYKFAPSDLPDKSCLLSKDLEWYFFCARDRKYSHGYRTNRATDIGYWKPTGRDRTIVYNSQKVGMKKTLIFHLGKSPKGNRTDWVMYEFRLDSSELANAGYTQVAYVLYKIFEKSGRGPRNGEQYSSHLRKGIGRMIQILRRMVLFLTSLLQKVFIRFALPLYNLLLLELMNRYPPC